MDSVGGFHVMEKDDKLSLVYHHSKYQPIPQTQSPTSLSDEVNDDQFLQPLFLCPDPRLRKANSISPIYLVNSSPDYFSFIIRAQKEKEHPVLPLFWCNNKEFDVDGGCDICSGSYSGTDYYFCEYCDSKYHKECIQSPLKIKHPYHPQHLLQLSYLTYKAPIMECFYCGRGAKGLVYHCAICEVVMHTACAMELTPFTVDQPKSHDHPLTFFPRQASLTCNVCGLIRMLFPTYVCLRCNFVSHRDCMYSPRIIKISRHHHRISYTSSLQSGEWSCGVCRKTIDGDYGAYTCDKCDGYAVHSRCAVRKDVWDGVELEGVPEEEEDDVKQDVGPFEIISEGVIHHFLHGHHLRLEVNILYDKKKLCEACVLPIYEGNFYSCMECVFILHETCAKARRRIQHALHPHPLTLHPHPLLVNSVKVVDKYYPNLFLCDACDRESNGFVYRCHKGECNFDLDVRCASISEPFDYQGHKHPLFLALGPEETPICQVCKSKSYKPLNCIKCDFIICMKCATLPYEAKYKHDKHFLRILCGEEVCEKDWCEVCESNIGDTCTKMLYWCNECCTTIHVKCLLNEEPYMKPGHLLKLMREEIQIVRKNSISRQLCDSCKKPCQDILFKTGDYITCSLKCRHVRFMLNN